MKTATVSKRFGVSRARNGRLLLDAVGTLGLNITAVALNAVVFALLTHRLGANAYGDFASAIAWAAIFSIVAVLGLTPLVIREVAAHSSSASWALLRGLLRRANQAVALASTLTIGAAALVGWAIYRDRTQLLHPYLVALLLVPVIALTSLRQAAIQGLGRVVVGRLPEAILVPVLFIALLIPIPRAIGHHFTPAVAVALQVGVTFVGFVVGTWLLRRVLPTEVRASAAEYRTASWRRSTAPLLLLNVVMAANAQVGTIMLGALRHASDAGVFNAAFRVTTFISFIMLAASYPLSPLVARLHAEGARRKIEETAVHTARIVLVATAPLAIVLVAFAGPVLAHLAGHDFGAGSTAVRIMAVGDVVNVLTGFGGLVLVMCGRESDLARSVALGAVVNIGLAAALIPPFGVNGAAIATASSLALSNLLMTWFAWRRLGVWAAVGRFKTRVAHP